MTRLKPNIKSKNNRVSLNWTQLNAVIEGISAIDLGSLAIRNRREAGEFAREYGFNTENSIDLEQIAKTHGEAVRFIEEFFLTPEQKPLMSAEVRLPEHLLDLLVFSSNYLNKSNLRQMWACAVLKVMHSIFHVDHDFKLKYFDVIRKQIFEPLDGLLLSDSGHHFLSDGNITIPLYFFEKKRNKGRNSILLKLLQKPNYVASDIYDHLGMRLIFETKAECLFALKLLRKSHLISVTNIKPFRSRNNLIDLETAKKTFSHFRPMLERSKAYPSRIFRKMDEELEANFIKRGRRHNPHSSKDYQVIQVTARKMVRVPNPVYEQLTLWRQSGEMKNDLPNGFLLEAEAHREFALYFDYEIQLLDKKSYLQSLHGPTSHEAYKQRQRQAAKRRALGPQLIKYLTEQGTS